MGNFEAQTPWMLNAQKLEQAMKEVKTNEKVIIKVIANCSNSDRQRMIESYRKQFNADLITDLKNKTNGLFQDAIVALFALPIQYDSLELQRAIKGHVINEDVLIEILGSRTNNWIATLKEQYNKDCQSNLETDVKNKISGDFEKLIMAILLCKRSNNTGADQVQAENDANALYKADESTFNIIFSQRSHAEILALANTYQKLYNKQIVDVIEDTKGNFKTIINAMINPTAYFASRLNSCGTNDEAFIRILVARFEIDLPQIKEAYMRIYKVTLTDAIEKKCSGSYKELLLELAGEKDRIYTY